MITITGTCYFPTIDSAIAYYHRQYSDIYSVTKEIVADKIKSEEIYIGRPALKSGETLFIKDNRYHIQEGN